MEPDSSPSSAISLPGGRLPSHWLPLGSSFLVCKAGRKDLRWTSTLRASLGAQSVKSLPAAQERQVQSLGQEDPLEKGMAPHSSILAWEFPWIEEPGGLQTLGSQESDRT